MIQAVEGHLYHSHGAVHNHLPGVDDGGCLLSLKHDGCDLRRVGQISDACFNDFKARIGNLLLDFITDSESYDLAGPSEAAFIRDTVSGGVHVGSHVIGIDPHNIPECAVTLQGEIFLIIIHVKYSLGGVNHPPHNGNSDLNRISQAVVDFLAVIVQCHDLERNLPGRRFGR